MPQAPWAQPPPLPDPPALEVWLFEQPVVSAGLALGAGALAWFVLRAKGKPRQGTLAGGGLVALAVVLAVVGFVVETARERLAALSGDLLAAARAGDAARLDGLLADDLVLDLGGRGGDSGDKALVLEAVGKLKEQAVIDAVRVRSPVSLDGPNAARSQVWVRTGGAGFGPSLSWWMVSWRREAGGEWRAHLIELLLLNGEKPRGVGEEMRRSLR